MKVLGYHKMNEIEIRVQFHQHSTDSFCTSGFMGVRWGGQGGLLPPPGRPRPAKNRTSSMFLDFFGKK
jgi:hypothetical protein